MIPDSLEAPLGQRRTDGLRPRATDTARSRDGGAASADPARGRAASVPSPDGLARRSFGRDAAGATAVEFAILVWPFLMMCLGILQFMFLHFNQDSLSNALFAIASRPDILSKTNTQVGYVSNVCANNAFTTNCTANLKLERYTLANLPAVSTAISGAVWQGQTGDVVVLRASLDTLKVVGFIPTLTARESVVYVLP